LGQFPNLWYSPVYDIWKVNKLQLQLRLKMCRWNNWSNTGMLLGDNILSVVDFWVFMPSFYIRNHGWVKITDFWYVMLCCLDVSTELNGTTFQKSFLVRRMLAVSCSILNSSIHPEHVNYYSHCPWAAYVMFHYAQTNSCT
jgi:hypothetical protein